MFGVTILGNNSAIPAYSRFPTAQVVTMNESLFLVDCGEGTQIQLSKYKIRRSRINHIFISHMHGDHYFGLPGLINSMGLLCREQELHLHAPLPLKEILDLQFAAANTKLPFELVFHPFAEEGTIVDHSRYSVECFRVFHRIDCWGFIFREKKSPRRINREKALEYGVPELFYNRLKEGEDYIKADGSTISNEQVTIANTPNRSYAYCADTVYMESLAEKVKHASLLYHETTYLKDQEERAASRFHSTTIQAASLAKLAGVQRLVIGHFSSKYETLDAFETEAREIFDATQLGTEGATFLV